MSRPPGLLLLDKPEGLTSFQCLGPVKRALGTKKIGHCGTLDKFASGLMILLSERATKLAPAFTDMDKRYRARIRFGQETDTLDPEGRVVAEAPLPDLSRFEEVLESFVGELSQVPPAYSAIHLDGQRAYQRVRAGQDVQIPPRQISIYSIEVMDLGTDFAVLNVHCSKGTYIRSLARDLALAVGSRGHLTALRRTAIGRFVVEDAVSPQELNPARDLRTGMELAGEIHDTEVLSVDSSDARELRFGRLPSGLAARAGETGGQRVACVWDGDFVALLRGGPRVRIDWVVPGGAN